MLEILDLTKRYSGGIVAIEGVSLSVSTGVLGLLGPNGAGKTTLMSIVATVSKPTSGTVRWNGSDIVRQPQTIRRELGFLPQDFGVYEKLTATEFLTYLGRLKGLGGPTLPKAVDQLLTLVNLHHAKNRRLGGFSGGMRQRVGIAQALLGDPRILVVDEPTVGLDPEERLRFRNLLSEIAHDRLVILSTHIVSDVEAIASTIAVLRKGRLVAHATPEAMLLEATGRVFRVVIAPDHLAEIQKRVAVSNLAHRPNGVHVRFVGDGSAVSGAESVEPTLEDAYLLAERGRADGVAA